MHMDPDEEDKQGAEEDLEEEEDLDGDPIVEPDEDQQHECHSGKLVYCCEIV